jgi:hypothetical protein
MFNSSVTPKGFRVGIHKPSYSVPNLRSQEHVCSLGEITDGKPYDNQQNFPDGEVVEQGARWIYEITNSLPFRGATYIDSGWAEAKAAHPESICIAPTVDCSLQKILAEYLEPDKVGQIFAALPRPVLYDLAANSTDARELVTLAENCCRMSYDNTGLPTGLVYKKECGRIQADIDDFELFETVANNRHLPDRYKQVMVLRPGVQGASEIVGDFEQSTTHVFEYLRRNSYIPWGHFAANMADDAIRYRTAELNTTDMQGLRHLYYQRCYVTLAVQLGLEIDVQARGFTGQELEQLRLDLGRALQHDRKAAHSATLWGWNYGYGFCGSGYRLHASHQMIHQQYAMVPETVRTLDGGEMPCFGCGDQVADTVARYRQEYERDFFSDYLAAIRANRRMDDRDLSASLIVYEDASILVFVPKAQVSQWELQLMVTADADGQPVGNIFEADGTVRTAIDNGILMVQHIYAGLGARMVTSIEYPKRIGVAGGQRLLYSFLPKLPWSMGAFSEAQQRYICGHFPEDFARACRFQISEERNQKSDVNNQKI